MTIGIDAGLGPFADRNLSYWDESFVPMELMRHMREIHRVDAMRPARPFRWWRAKLRLADARNPDPLETPPDWFWQALCSPVNRQSVSR